MTFKKLEAIATRILDKIHSDINEVEEAIELLEREAEK